MDESVEGQGALVVGEILEDMPMGKGLDNSPKDSVGYCEVGIQEEGLELLPILEDVCCLDFWNKSKFKDFSKFIGFSTTKMEKDILKFFQKLSRSKIIINKELSEKT